MNTSSITNNPVVAGVLASILVAYVIYTLVYKYRIMAGKAEKHLAHITGAEETEDDIQDTVAYDPNSLAYKFQAAGLNIPPDQGEIYLLGISAGMGVTALGIALLIGFPLVLALTAAVLAALYPRQWLDGKVKQIGKDIDKQLPVAISRIAAMIQVKSDLESVLLSVSETLTIQQKQSPLAKELRQTALGLRHEGRKALKDAEHRAAHLSPSLGTLAFQLNRYLEKGGASFAEAFEMSADNMENIINARNKTEAKAASILSGVRMIPAVLALTILFFLKNPSTSASFQMPIVQLVLGGAVVWMGIGYWFIKGMVEEVG